MFNSCRSAGVAFACLMLTVAVAEPRLRLPQGQHGAAYEGIGRPATPSEITAWDIDVRGDFKGLPKGAGTVARGQTVWESKCASCHGVFGESNEVFAPLVGGTTSADILSGRVDGLRSKASPRTTLMKLSTVSTLWDYIRRAMPWTQPQSLTIDEVYAVTAYLLNLGGVIGDDFTLSDANIAQVQQRLPNRHGMTTDHDLWPGARLSGQTPQPKPAAQRTVACMHDCDVQTTILSALPAHARGAQGNLAQQNRLVGAQRGLDLMSPVPVGSVIASGSIVAATDAITALLQKNNCLACHGMDAKILGPSLNSVAGKYASRADASSYLASKIKNGGSGVWGDIAMPAQALSEDEAAAIAHWLASGAKQ